MSTIVVSDVPVVPNSSADVATDPIWTAEGDQAVGTGAGTAVVVHIGAAGQVWTSDGTTASWEDPTGVGGGTAADIPFTPAGAIAATDVQGAIEEVAAEAGAGSVTSVNGDVGPAVDLVASEIPFTPSGSISATDVQGAIQEVAAEAGGTPGAHAATHGDGGADEVALDASQITTGTLDDARIPAGVARDSEVATAITNHEAASDPHPGYLTVAEGNAAYDPLGAFVSPTAAEFIRDTIGVALTAGAHISIVVSDAGDTITLAVTGLTSADLSDFNTAVDERARDALAAALVAGTGISITPNDPGDTITIAVTGLTSASLSDFTEAVQDVVGAFVAAGTGLTATYNDAGNVETIGIDTSAEAERIDDRVGALLVAGTNVTLTYNDAGNTLTIAATATALPDSGAEVTTAGPSTVAVNQIYRINTTSNAVARALPSAPAVGSQVLFKITAPNPQVNAFTWSTSGSDVINRAGGATSGTLVVVGAWAQFTYIGSNVWIKIEGEPLAQLDLRYAPITLQTLAAIQAFQIAAANSASKVMTGGVVSPSATAGKVDITAGRDFNTDHAVPVGVLTAQPGVIQAGGGSNADATNPRWGVYETDSAGALQLTLGAAAATPVIPDVTTGRVAHALLYIPANATLLDELVTTINGKAKLIQCRSLRPALPVVQQSSVALGSATNPTSLTTILPSLPALWAAGEIQVGDVIEIFVAGKFTLSTSASTVEFKAFAGPTQIFDYTTASLAVGVRYWTMRITLLCTAASTFFAFYEQTITVPSVAVVQGGTAVGDTAMGNTSITPDTTIAAVFDLQARLGTGNASSTVTAVSTYIKKVPR